MLCDEWQAEVTELLEKSILALLRVSALCLEAEALRKAKQTAWEKLSLEPITEPLRQTKLGAPPYFAFSNKSHPRPPTPLRVKPI